MSNRTKLRLISLGMLLIAAVFVFCALSCPTLGRVFSIGPFQVTAQACRAFYKGYAAVMAGLFAASFLGKGTK